MSNEFNAPPRWIMSFADLLSVILCFFVLIYSMSMPKDKLAGKYDNDTQNYISVETAKKNRGVSLTKTDINLSTSYLLNVITEKANRDDDLKKLKLKTEDEKILISLAETEFNEQLAPKLAALLKPISNNIYLFTGDLDKSYQIATILNQNNMEKEIAIMESPNHKGKIDFVIYP